MQISIKIYSIIRLPFVLDSRGQEHYCNDQLVDPKIVILYCYIIIKLYLHQDNVNSFKVVNDVVINILYIVQIVRQVTCPDRHKHILPARLRVRLVIQFVRWAIR